MNTDSVSVIKSNSPLLCRELFSSIFEYIPLDGIDFYDMLLPTTRKWIGKTIYEIGIKHIDEQYFTLEWIQKVHSIFPFSYRKKQQITARFCQLGNIPAIDWSIQNNFKINYMPIAVNGCFSKLPVFQYFFERMEKTPENIRETIYYTYSPWGGSMECLNYMYEQYPEIVKSMMRVIETIGMASREKNLKLIQWIEKKNLEGILHIHINYKLKLSDMILYNYSMEDIMYIISKIEEKYGNDYSWIEVRYFVEASKYCYNELMKYLYQHMSTEMKNSIQSNVYNSFNKKSEDVYKMYQWLQEIGIPYDTQYFYNLVTTNSKEIFQYVFYEICTEQQRNDIRTNFSILKLKYVDSISVLEWFYENSILILNKEIYREIVRLNSFEMIVWYHQKLIENNIKIIPFEFPSRIYKHADEHDSSYYYESLRLIEWILNERNCSFIIPNENLLYYMTQVEDDIELFERIHSQITKPINYQDLLIHAINNHVTNIIHHLWSMKVPIIFDNRILECIALQNLLETLEYLQENDEEISGRIAELLETKQCKTFEEWFRLFDRNEYNKIFIFNKMLR